MPQHGTNDSQALRDMDAPANGAAAVTPSDTVDLVDGICRSLYVGTTGNISLITAQGDTVLFSSVPVGILPVRASRIKATSTTASNIVALY